MSSHFRQSWPEILLRYLDNGLGCRFRYFEHAVDRTIRKVDFGRNWMWSLGSSEITSGYRGSPVLGFYVLLSHATVGETNVRLTKASRMAGMRSEARLDFTTNPRAPASKHSGIISGSS